MNRRTIRPSMKPLRRSGPMRRGGKLAAKSDNGRRLRFDRELAGAEQVVRRRSGTYCEAAIAPDCAGCLQDFHHRRGRVGSGCNDPVLLLAVCRACHAFIESHPALSFRVGLRLHWWDTPREFYRTYPPKSGEDA